jgi:predicted RNase H-like HicB family nuclease
MGIMILEYLDAAMSTARYEMIEDREPFYGEIPDLQGVWASGETLEGCRKNLAAAVEDWILFSIARGKLVPPIGDVAIEIPHRVA